MLRWDEGNTVRFLGPAVSYLPRTLMPPEVDTMCTPGNCRYL